MSNQLALDIQNTDQKTKMHISFSGGLSSAYMTEWLMKNLKDQYDFIVTFANTGLELEEHNGNCVMCFEKSFSKLLKQMEEYPEALAFHEEMERKHGQTNNKAGMPDRVFFRKKTSALDLRSMAQEQDSKEVEQTNYADTLLVA